MTDCTFMISLCLCTCCTLCAAHRNYLYDHAFTIYYIFLNGSVVLMSVPWRHYSTVMSVPWRLYSTVMSEEKVKTVRQYKDPRWTPLGQLTVWRYRRYGYCFVNLWCRNIYDRHFIFWISWQFTIRKCAIEIAVLGGSKHPYREAKTRLDSLKY